MDNCRGYIFLSDTSADEGMESQGIAYFENNHPEREHPQQSTSRRIPNSVPVLPDLVPENQNNQNSRDVGGSTVDHHWPPLPHRSQSSIMSQWANRAAPPPTPYVRQRNTRLGTAMDHDDGRFSPRETGNPSNAHSSNSQSQAELMSNQNGSGEPPSTRIEDDVLHSIQELRNQYIYQFAPAFQLDLDEQFGPTSVMSRFGVAMSSAATASNPGHPPQQPQTQITQPIMANFSARIRALRLASERALIRLRHQTNLPDSDVTSSDGDDSTPVPAAHGNQAQTGTSNTIGVSVSFTPASVAGTDAPLMGIEQLEEISNSGEGLSLENLENLRKTLQILRRAITMQTEPNGQGIPESAPMVASAAQQFHANAVEAINRERVRIARINQGLNTPERPNTEESNFSNFELDFNVWDAESTMNNLNIFNGESDSSEEDFGGRQEPPVITFGSLSLQAIFNGGTREFGTSTRETVQDAAMRARERGRRPAFQVPRNVSPDTREFYRSIGLPSGDGDPGQNVFNDFIIMSNPRAFTEGDGNQLGNLTPVPLYEGDKPADTKNEAGEAETDTLESSENEMYEDGTESECDWAEEDSEDEDTISHDVTELRGTMTSDKLAEVINESDMGKEISSYLSGLPICPPKVDLDQDDEELQSFLDEIKRNNEAFEQAVAELMGIVYEAEAPTKDLSTQSVPAYEIKEPELEMSIEATSLAQEDSCETPFCVTPENCTLEDPNPDLTSHDTKKESNLKVFRNKMSTCLTNMKNCATALTKK